jgi:hypothetical protein
MPAETSEREARRRPRHSAALSASNQGDRNEAKELTRVGLAENIQSG